MSGPESSLRGADVTVVVVTWEQRDLTRRCLASLQRQTVAHDVLVVDNDSHDGTGEMIDREFPSTRVLTLSTNTGFAGGVNAALSQVSTRFVALLNNDAEAEPSWLERSVADLADATVAAVSAKMLLAGREPESGPGVLNNAGVVLLRSGYGADRGLGQPDDGGFDEPAEVFGFSGGAAVLRTLAVKAVGGIDDSYFMYYEDTDLSWRLRLAGWSIRYRPDAVVHHRHAASSDVSSEMFAFHNERNRLLTLLSNAPAGFAVTCLLRFGVTTASLAVTRGLGRSVEDHPVFRTGLRMRVLGSVMQRLPSVLARRRSAPTARSRSAVLSDWRGVPERAIGRAAR